MNKKFTVSFCGYNAVKKNEEYIRQRAIENQKRRSPYGMILYPVETTTFFKKNFIVLVGIIETDFKVKNSLGNEIEIGFNLALIKKNEDLYGEWFKIKFLQNHKEPSCAINLDKLLEQYESFSLDPFVTADFSALQDKDLEYMLEKIML